MSRGGPNVQTTGAGQALGDRLPPHSLEAEIGVVGCCFMDARQCLPGVVARFGGCVREVFYDLRHLEVFEAIAGLADRLVPVDIVTVHEELKKRGRLEEIGGLYFLTTLEDAVPSAANWSYYAEIVWEMFLRRRMAQVCRQCAELLESPTMQGRIEEVLDGVEAEVLAVGRLGSGGEAGARGMGGIVGEALQQIEDIKRGVGMIVGMRTHFGHLDKWTAGLHRKQMVILAGRPRLGKTSLAMGMAENIARGSGAGLAPREEAVGVGVFSMEMEDLDLVVRMLCGAAEVDSHKLRTGFASEAELERLPAAGLKLGQLPIWIDCTPALGILELKARARRMVSEHGVGVIVVDYLQLMHGSRDYRDNRALEVAEISGGLKALAKELNVALVVLSQLNRETEKAKNRKPQLADLRESGAIEQDADTVLMLYRPKGDEEKEEDGEPAEVIRVNALIAKQRHGPSDWDVEFLFHRRYTRFADAYGNRGCLPVQPGSEGEPRMGPDGAGGFHGSEGQSDLPGGEIPEDL